MFAVNQTVRKQKKKIVNRKKFERKFQFSVFKKNELFTKENRFNDDVD